MSPEIPIELHEYIIDFLWDDLSTLRNCALVCRDWRPTCRYHLEAFIRVHDHAEIDALYSQIS
ncbi:hypothetical protein OBBRIDRAFT_694338, partial [Obba rivulosa]